MGDNYEQALKLRSDRKEAMNQIAVLKKQKNKSKL
jgi:hypothetical protein